MSCDETLKHTFMNIFYGCEVGSEYDLLHSFIPEWTENGWIESYELLDMSDRHHIKLTELGYAIVAYEQL